MREQKYHIYLDSHERKLLIHSLVNKDGTYKEVYYYICGRNKQERGHHCDYKASLRKTDIEPLVIEAVKELVSDKYFAKEIEKRIGVQTDTTAIDKELANYESKLKEVDLNKARLEREIDNLPNQHFARGKNSAGNFFVSFL